jgi:hypothetical protein
MVGQCLTAMVAPAKSAETWQALMELRCKREVLERWLAGRSLPKDLEQTLETMLCEIKDQLQLLAQG